MLNWFWRTNTNTQSTRKYGWKHTEELLEHEVEKYPFRELKYHKNLASIKEVDLIPKFPPIYDQGNLGSCTANAIIGTYEYTMNKENEKYEQMSRLGLYWMERYAEHPN